MSDHAGNGPAGSDHAGSDHAGTNDVFRLVYRSHDLLPAEARKRELGALFTNARANNKQAGVTGALLVTDDYFVQTLEGEEATVRDLFDHIRADPRHDEVTVVESGRVEDRVFARWSMARVSEQDEPDVNLIAHQDGISDASRRGDETPEQDALLRAMRDAAQGTVRQS